MTPASVARDERRALEERERDAYTYDLGLSQANPVLESVFARPGEGVDGDANDRFVTFDYWKKKMLLNEVQQTARLQELNKKLRAVAEHESATRMEAEQSQQRLVRKLENEVIARGKIQDELREALVACEKAKKLQVEAEAIAEKWIKNIKRERLTRKKADLMRIRLQQRMNRTVREYKRISYCRRLCTALCWCWCINEECECCNRCFDDPQYLADRADLEDDERLGPVEVIEQYGLSLVGLPKGDFDGERLYGIEGEQFDRDVGFSERGFVVGSAKRNLYTKEGKEDGGQADRVGTNKGSRGGACKGSRNGTIKGSRGSSGQGSRGSSSQGSARNFDSEKQKKKKKRKKKRAKGA